MPRVKKTENETETKSTRKRAEPKAERKTSRARVVPQSNEETVDNAVVETVDEVVFAVADESTNDVLIEEVVDNSKKMEELKELNVANRLEESSEVNVGKVYKIERGSRRKELGEPMRQRRVQVNSSLQFSYNEITERVGNARCSDVVLSDMLKYLVATTHREGKYILSSIFKQTLQAINQEAAYPLTNQQTNMGSQNRPRKSTIKRVQNKSG